MRLLILLAAGAAALFAQHTYTASDIEDGARLYRANCVTCHGPDGDKLAKADLSHGKFRRASSDEELVKIIEKGIPGTEMKGNDSINDFQASSIVAYLRSFVTNPKQTNPELTGDPARGKELFDHEGGCLSCHRVGLTGSRLGPNLTEVGSNRRDAELEHVLLSPNADAMPQNRYVRVVTNDGRTISGRLLNIDTFSVQLLDSNESLRSFSRSDLREATILRESAMPSYKDKLSPQQIADLVSYLASLKAPEKQ